MLNKIKLVAGSTALLGALLVSGCMPPPAASTASCCGGKKGEHAVADIEPGLVTPPTVQAMTDGAEAIPVDLDDTQKGTLKTATETFRAALDTAIPLAGKGVQQQLVTLRSTIDKAIVDLGGKTLAPTP
jgi:hypothetical protein